MPHSTHTTRAMAPLAAGAEGAGVGWPPASRAVRPRPRGLSLLELVLGMALGLVVVAAVTAQYLAAGQAGRLQAAQAQLAEDAQIALALLRSELRMAGYAQPLAIETGGDGQPRWRSALDGPGLFACDNGFASPSTTGAVTCAASGHSAALELRYQADAHNTVPLSGSTRPSDCLGAGLRLEGGVYLTHNRWYVAGDAQRSELRCASRLGHAGQPLVEGVETLALWFGLAAPGATGPAGPPVRYVRAAEVGDFAQVRSVRLCVLLRSREPVVPADLSADYLDCEGAARSAADRRLRRAFHATVALGSAP